MKNNSKLIKNINTLIIFFIAITSILSVLKQNNNNIANLILLICFPISGILSGIEIIQTNKQTGETDNENAWIFIILGIVMLIATFVIFLWRGHL